MRFSCKLALWVVVAIAAMLFVDVQATAAEKPMVTLTKASIPARKFESLGQVFEVPAHEGARVVLTNRLAKPLEFKCRPVLLLIPVVRNEAGEVIASGKTFGRLTSGLTPEEFSIAPGASYEHELGGLLDLVPDEKRKPGKYHVRIRFEYQGTAWESNEIEIEHK